MCNETIIKETVEATDFIWKDENVRLQAGELLSALITLSESQKNTNVICDNDVAGYLVQKGYVSKEDNGEYKVNSERKQDIIDLGNKVSNAIDNELENYVDKTVESTPTILIMPVPIGVKAD